MELDYLNNNSNIENYDAPFLAENSGNLPLRQAIQVVTEIFSLHDDNRDDLESQTRDLTAFIDTLLAQKTIPGHADDWHNLAVDIARNDYFDLACDILESGLDRFPNNPDLLGDYLQYGVSCGRIEKCEQAYDRLNRMPRVKYTWRSFHFSAKWLTHLYEQNNDEEILDELIQRLLAVTSDYRRYFPNSEESYLCEADIHKLRKDSKKELKALNMPLTRSLLAPKCALRLADYHFEAGDYAKSMEMIDRSLKDANQVQQAVNEAYLYYLSGLCKISLLTVEPDSSAVESIYTDFEYSLQLKITDSFRDSMSAKVGILRKKYPKVHLPEQCTKLKDLLGAKGELD